MITVDLNCDMGESFGPWEMGSDAEIMRFVSSVNVACGFHAGDPTTMRRTVELAVENGVAVGAHPGYPDLQGFGRRDIRMSANEVYDIVLYQAAALKGICEAKGTRLHHVKPHGALYNKAARDAELARAIARAVKALDPSLALYGLSGSCLIAEAEAAGLRAFNEVFADRAYSPDGSLAPRSEPGAVIHNPAKAAERAVGMAATGVVAATDGQPIRLRPDTICIHGDAPNAAETARAIYEALKQQGATIAAP